MAITVKLTENSYKVQMVERASVLYFMNILYIFVRI